MPELLRLDWKVDRDGYDTVLFDPADVDWDDIDLETGKFGLKPGAKASTAAIVTMLGSMVTFVDPEKGEPYEPEPYYFLVEKSANYRRIDPLAKNQALFAEFADTTCSLESVKAFVDKHGLPHDGRYTSYNAVVREIRKMKRAVTLWETGKQKGDLSGFIRAFNSRMWSMSSFELGSSHDPLHPSLHIVPFDLLTGMWIQLAQNVSAHTGLRRCIWCSKPFVYGTGTGRRKSAHHCSIQCQKADWKHGKEGKK